MSEQKNETAGRETPSKIVKLNVGGKHYEVSRNLIVKDGNSTTTMLSCLISETWHRDPEAEVFIDRDGERFSYVLDYLRHGEVVLPNNVSSAELFKDLDFYGIVPREGTIRKENCVFKELEALKNDVKEKRKDYNTKKRKLRELEKEMQVYEQRLEKEREHLNLSTKILNHYHTFKEGSICELGHESHIDKQGIHNIYKVSGECVRAYDYEQDLLNKYLEKFSLQLNGWDRGHLCIVKFME